MDLRQQAGPHGGLTVSGQVRVDGLNRLVRDMTAMGVEIADLKLVFGDLASRGANLASSLAPTRSGKLAASVKGNKAKNKAVIVAGSKRIPYAGAINYGWRKRNIRPSRFMQRADDILAPDAAKEIDTALSRLIAEQGLS